MVLLALVVMGHALAQPPTNTRIAAGQTWQMDFTAPKLDAKGEVHLFLKARVDWPTLGGGSNPVMILLVNGKPPGAASLKNKPLQFTMRDGSDTSWLWGNAWRVVFCPDFSDKIRTEPLSVGIPDTDPFSFEWDITPLVQPGKNTISIRHDKLLEQPVELVLEGVQVKRVGRDGRGPRAVPESHSVNTRRKLSKYLSGAFQPARPGQVLFSPQGSLVVNGVEVQSRFSLPGGSWFSTGAAGASALQPGQPISHSFSAGDVQVVRTVTLQPTRVQVVDHLKNATGGTVGVILEHRFQASGTVFLGGRKAFSGDQNVEEPAHPTVFWDVPGKALGLVAEDDIFRVHVRSFQKGGWAGLSDPRMAIPGSSERLVEWSLYSVAEGDYWDFINTVRRDWKVNQTLGWPLVFESGASSYATQYAVGPARARWVTLQATFPDGKLAEGTAIEQALPWCTGVARQVQELAARGKVMMYLHGQICTESNAAQLYADSQALKLSGGQVLSPYSYPVLVFLPTLSNTYGNALFASVLRALALTHVGGVYWDELSYATERYVQAEPWDNCSAEISPESHALVGLISSVPLLKQPWDGKMVRELQGKGMDLVGNGPAFTRSTMQLMVPRIAETSSYRNLVDLHLSTPWGLANHELDRTVASNMRMTHRILDFGCLMTPFHMEKEPYPWVDALYPFTPVELRSGVLMGKERIVTNRSGVFGWADGSPFEVVIFNLKGQRVRASKAGPEVELKLKPGELAVLIRRGGKP